MSRSEGKVSEGKVSEDESRKSGHPVDSFLRLKMVSNLFLPLTRTFWENWTILTPLEPYAHLTPQTIFNKKL